MKIKEWYRSLYHLFLPNHCWVCHKTISSQQGTFCFNCQHLLEETNHFSKEKNDLYLHLSKIEGMDISFVNALYYFRKTGVLQDLIHKLKYQNKIAIGHEFGTILASKLQNHPMLESIDYIIPVPLHPKKLKERGYNQSLIIAQALAKKLQIPVKENWVRRIKYTESQTHKSREERFKNMEDVFEWSEECITLPKHVLIIDDIITTGATLWGIYHQKPKNIEISVASIGFTID
jgi:ComF family protein